MPTLYALLDRLTGIPANAPLFDSFTQRRSMARVLAEMALCIAAIVASTAAILALRWHLGLS